MKPLLYLFLALVIFLAGCTPVSLAAPSEPDAVGKEVAQALSDVREEPAQPVLQKMTLETCPVTLPPDQPFTPPAPYPSTAPYTGQYWYGTETLWTSLPVDGQWGQLALGEKMFWWREGFDGGRESQPNLSVSAQRLDAKAPTVTFGPPATNAYHEDFHSAMLIGVDLPSSGCWEITGHYEKQVLSFVVWVGETP